MFLCFYRCPDGQVRASPERAECVYDSDCFGVNQCLNGGTCISENGFSGSGYSISGRTLCLCPPFFEGARCEIATDGRTVILTGSRDFIIIIIFAIATLLSKFLFVLFTLSNLFIYFLELHLMHFVLTLHRSLHLNFSY